MKYVLNLTTYKATKKKPTSKNSTVFIFGHFCYQARIKEEAGCPVVCGGFLLVTNETGLRVNAKLNFPFLS